MTELIQKKQEIDKQRTRDQIGTDTGNAKAKVMDGEYSIETLYLYQIWNGANRFLCYGSLITGPNYTPFLVALFLIILPTVMMIIFFNDQWKVTTVLGSIVLYLKLRVAFSDPGIVSRAQSPFQEDELKQIPQNKYNLPTEGIYLINADGHSQLYKICETCMIYKNKDRRHCRQCDNCVCQFDHHCVWLNNCIGKRNYTNFIGYLIFLIAHIIHIMVMCITYIVDETTRVKEIMHLEEREALNKVLAHQPLSIILIIYGSIFKVLIATLLSFHVYLLFKNMTTAEFTKQVSRLQKRLPTSLISAFKYKFSFLIRKPYLDFRQQIVIKTKRELTSACLIEKNPASSSICEQIEQNGIEDKANKNSHKSVILPLRNDNVSPIRSLDNTLGVNGISRNDGETPFQDLPQSKSDKSKQGKKQTDTESVRLKNENQNSQQDMQNVYVTHDSTLKKIRLPSIILKGRNKRSTNFIKCSGFSTSLQPVRSLKDLSEMQQVTAAAAGGGVVAHGKRIENIEDEFKGYLELSGIEQKKQFNLKKKQILPSPQIQSRQELNQGEEEGNCTNNDLTIQKSQLFDENEIVSISYYTENNDR